MLYSIDGIENILDLIAYTVSAMKEVGYGDCDVDDYIEEAIKSNSYDTIILSKEKLNDCNILSNEVRPSNNDLFEDTWCNHYCSSFWDDDGRYSKDDEDEIDSYDYITGCKKTSDNNVIDDIETDEAEAYEGFSSCNNHYWDSSEEDEYEDNSCQNIRNYYDSMREEFDPSYDEHCDPWYWYDESDK